jgi:hypothetical protein
MQHLAIEAPVILNKMSSFSTVTPFNFSACASLINANPFSTKVWS